MLSENEAKVKRKSESIFAHLLVACGEGEIHPAAEPMRPMAAPVMNCMLLTAWRAPCRPAHR